MTKSDWRSRTCQKQSVHSNLELIARYRATRLPNWSCQRCTLNPKLLNFEFKSLLLHGILTKIQKKLGTLLDFSTAQGVCSVGHEMFIYSSKSTADGRVEIPSCPLHGLPPFLQWKSRRWKRKVRIFSDRVDVRDCNNHVVDVLV